MIDAVGLAVEHERARLSGVALLRADAVGRAAVATVEQQPELRSSAAFRQLMDQLIACENRLAAARRFYNDAVTVIRDRANTFPTVLLRPVVFGRRMPRVLVFGLADGHLTEG